MASTASFANGDGLCFINVDRELVGFRVNRAEGNRLFPLKMPEGLKPGMSLYRNNDEAFGKVLARQTAVRKVPLHMKLRLTSDGVELETAIVHAGECVQSRVDRLQCEHQQAQKPQRENIVRQLTKLGSTPYTCSEVDLDPAVEGLFIPSSLLADLRRRATDALMNPPLHLTDQPRTLPTPSERKQTLAWTPMYKRHSYLYNASNHLSKAFYEAEGMPEIGDAFEVKKPQPKDALLMQCRHCIRFSLGHCVKHGGTKPTWKEPLYLQLGDNRRFRLDFNCAECQMDLYAE